MGWYRIHFEGRNIAGTRPLGVFFGRIGDIDEVFLNGHKIGGEGVMGDLRVEAPFVQRLYRVPRTLILPDRDNLLAVRVMNTYVTGGIFENPVVLGDYSDLLLLKTERENAVTRVDLILLVSLSVFVVFFFLIHLSGVREKEYLAFAVFVLLYTVEYLLDSLIFYQSGLKTHILQKLVASLMMLLPASFLIFLSLAVKQRATRLLKWILLSYGALAVGFLFSVSPGTYLVMSYVWMALSLVSAWLALRYSVSAYRRNVQQSAVFLVAIGVVSLGMVNWILELLGIVPAREIYGRSVSEYVLPATVLCFVYAIDVRFSETLENIKTFSEKILLAHEEERKRLARDLHDGLGQSLLTTKFNLERMNQERQDGVVRTAVEELSGNIDELREISSGLRPPFLEEMGLPAALKMHCLRVAKKTGLEIEVKADLASRPHSLIEENLFRIVQEAISNASKHASANHITVRLDGAKDRLTMEVEDNGRGFDYGKIRSGRLGIGLSTMSERASLMGGIFSIQSGRQGTTIRVEVPFL
jgi:signal transduction histidine kinase